MLLISPVDILTLNPARRVISNGALAIDGSRIADIGPAPALEARYPAAERLDGRGMLALPGLIDTHLHTDQTLLRGQADALTWRPYLREVIWPALARRDTEEADLALRLAMLEMIKSGTTCFVDCMVPARYDFDRLAATALESGLRAVMARYILPQALFEGPTAPPAAGPLTSEAECLAAAQAAIRRWHGAGGGRLQVWYGPLVPRDEPPGACDPAFYRRVSRLALEQASGLTIHYAATRDDLDFFQQRFGQTPLRFALDAGLTGPHVLLINACWLPAQEINGLAETGTRVAHSPAANMKMADGLAPVPAMRAAGLCVSLGCDAAANNNSLDMIREMRTAVLLHSLASGDPQALTAQAALEMATIDGARAIGREADLGSLEQGKQADIILVDLAKPHTTPHPDPVAALVHAAHGGDVDTVLVAGRVLMRGRQVVGVDEAALLAQVKGFVRDRIERSNHSRGA